MFNIGIGELMVVAIVALFVFGPGRLPEVARAFGRGIREFRKAMQEVSREMQLDDIREVKKSAEHGIRDVKQEIGMEGTGEQHGNKS